MSGRREVLNVQHAKAPWIGSEESKWTDSCQICPTAVKLHLHQRWIRFCHQRVIGGAVVAPSFELNIVVVIGKLEIRGLRSRRKTVQICGHFLEVILSKRGGITEEILSALDLYARFG